MQDRIRRELELVRQRFGELVVDPNLDWFVVCSMPLSGAWAKSSSRVLVLFPGGYPTTPPDNFYTDPDLRLATGALPGNVSENQQVAGATWLQFSYHVESADWRPEQDPADGHNLVTFLEGVRRRLEEPN